jgi:xanthine dehydrogenase accessory factor
MVMAQAKKDGFDASTLERVHAPIGLDISAETPAEIAVAIMAEIVNVRRQGKAPSLALGKRLHV